MIAELIACVSSVIAILNGGAVYLLYRQYIHLADLSLEFAGIITASLREDEAGVLQADPVLLAGISVDQTNKLYSALKWVCRQTTHT